MKQSAKDAITACLKAARDIADTAEAAGRDLSEDERNQVTQQIQKATEIKKRSDDADGIAKQLSDLSDGIGMVDADADPDARKPGAYGARGAKSLGHAFVDSAEYKALLAQVPEGRFGEKARVQSQPYGVKDLITGANITTGAGTLVVPDMRGLLDPAYQRPLTIRQLISPGTTGSDVVDYVRMVSVTNNAAPVPEATSAAVVDGTIVTDALAGVKPESALAFEKDTANVKTIAHWIPATKRALSDAAQIRTLIDNFLMYGLEESLENEMVGGDGSGEHFTGLAHTSGVQTQAAPGVGEDVFNVTRSAITKVETVGHTIASGFVMNPLDWEAIDLMRDGQNRFYGAGPFAMAAKTLWSLPVVTSQAIPAGTAWCANWKFAVLYDREQASIQVTDSHADFFVRNLVAILAEMRAAFAVLRPPAFVKIALV